MSVLYKQRCSVLLGWPFFPLTFHSELEAQMSWMKVVIMYEIYNVLKVWRRTAGRILGLNNIFDNLLTSVTNDSIQPLPS